MKKYIIAFVVVIFSLGLVACGGTSSKQTVTGVTFYGDEATVYDMDGNDITKRTGGYKEIASTARQAKFVLADDRTRISFTDAGGKTYYGTVRFYVEDVEFEVLTYSFTQSYGFVEWDKTPEFVSDKPVTATWLIVDWEDGSGDIEFMLGGTPTDWSRLEQTYKPNDKWWYNESFYLSKSSDSVRLDFEFES